MATEISSVRCGMPDKLGSRLRQVREQRRIALAAIARDTKIGLPLLEGLERDDVSHWPSGIFRRSFIRAYAQALGLEPDSVVTEFLEQFPDPSEVVSPESIIAARAAAPLAQQRPPTRLGVLWKAAVRYRDAWNPQIVAPLRSAVARARGARLSAVPGSRLLSFISKPRPASALQCDPSFDGSSPIAANITTGI